MALCECGCGEDARPGKRFIYQHYSRLLARAGKYTPPPTTCPRCGNATTIRRDGTLGRHYITESKYLVRRRCPEGETRTPAPAPPPNGRRVTVTMDVVVPADWNLHAFRGAAARAIRVAVADAFLVDLDAQETTDD